MSYGLLIVLLKKFLEVLDTTRTLINTLIKKREELKMTLVIRDMNPDDEEFVSMCGHSRKEAKEYPEFINDWIKCSDPRKKWFKEKYSQGFHAKVALLDTVRAGFLYVMPIEMCPWGPLGEDLLVVPCLNTNEHYKKKGIGSALLKAAEKEVKIQGKKGIVIIAYYWKDDFWFMPASYFKKCGYQEIKRVMHPSGNFEKVMLLKTNDLTVNIPDFLVRNYSYEPVSGKVVIDLFFNTFCQTSNTEAERVREV
jgi:GNAT superfamily N-acetyltransferase